MTAQTPSRIQPDNGPYADESIEHWAQVYAARQILAYGVLFETFMLFPNAILSAIEHGTLRRLDLSIVSGDTSMQSSTPEQRAAVLAVLSGHIGEAAGITARALVAEVNAQHPERAISERDLRSIVTDLRLDGAHVCAHPNHGYFIAATAEELERTIKFLRGRAMSSLNQINAMQRHAVPDLHGQQRLPT